MTPLSADLNAARRRTELEHAGSETVDLLVIGGGITGAGVALDAASRGLSVTLLEAEDLAFGTSRWSSKLVHGGLRYLATGDVATAKESALERHLLMTVIAPHLIRALPQLMPFAHGVSLRQRAAGAVGMGLGDLLRMRAHTPRSVLPTPHPVSARTARSLAPALAADGLRGGMLSYDGQLVDDARLVVAVCRTAASLGARILTRVRVSELRADGATAEDTVTGTHLDIRARSVVNATGVWAGELDPALTVRPSRGTHIVLDAADLGNPQAALTIPQQGSISRYVFALPQQLGRVIVGLTDEDAPGPIPVVPQPTQQEIDFLLTTLNRVLETSIRPEQVRGAFAGLRPLVDSGEVSTSDISRRHLVTVSSAGFVNVLGGKLTTYRRMAEDAVDLACRTRGLTAPPSTTSSLPLVGAVPVPVRASASSLVRRFGGEAARLRQESQIVDAQAPVASGVDVLRSEVAFAVLAEGALTVDDVLDRRTRIGLVRAERERCRPIVEEIVAEALAGLS